MCSASTTVFKQQQYKQHNIYVYKQHNIYVYAYHIFFVHTCVIYVYHIVFVIIYHLCVHDRQPVHDVHSVCHLHR